MSEINVNQVLSQLRSMATEAKGASELPNEVSAPGNFSSLLTDAVNHVNDTQKVSADLGNAFLSGDKTVDVTEVMIASQKAGIEFQLLMQVRNKVVTAYQEIMNMNI